MKKQKPNDKTIYETILDDRDKFAVDFMEWVNNHKIEGKTTKQLLKEFKSLK